MEQRSAGLGVKGLIAATAVAVLCLFALPDYALTAAPHAVLLPLLAAWFSPLTACLSGALSAVLTGIFLGMDDLATILLRSILPGMAAGWLVYRRMPYFRKIGAAALINAAGALAAALAVGLTRGAAYTENLAAAIASDSGRLNVFALFQASAAGYVSAGTVFEIVGAENLTASSAAWLLKENMGLALPASVCASAALTGLLAGALPARALARRGEADKDSYVPLEKWYVPNKWILALAGGVVLLVIAYGSGLESGALAAQVFVSLTSLALAVQGAAGLCSLMKRQDIHRGRRTAIIVALALLGGVLQIAGIGRTLLGSRGILRKLKEKMSKTDDDDEGGE